MEQQQERVMQQQEESHIQGQVNGQPQYEHGHLHKEQDHFEAREEVVSKEEAHVSENEIGFPGGPRDPSLLITYGNHIATSIWEGNERNVLKCHNHTSKLLQWEIVEDETTRQWRDLIMRSQLQGLRQVSYLDVNKPLVCAFVERWQPETNTFHMPFGEMSITLDDVFCLTGLPIVGKPIVSTRTPSPLYASQILRVPLADVVEGMEGKRGSGVKLEWIRDRFSGDVTSDDPVRVTCSARAYLWYLLGCTILSDKSGTRVSMSYLEWLEDLSDVHNYAWGAATLAYLYRQLGQASRVDTKQIAGSLTLLEAWIYLRFPSLRPPHNVEYSSSYPLALRWKALGNQGTAAGRVQAIREHLDSLTAHDVEWTPYDRTVREHFPFDTISLYWGCIAMGGIVEPYHPDRVLRQFGYVQTIPCVPIAADCPVRDDLKTQSLWCALAAYWHIAASHVLQPPQLGRLAQVAADCAPGYIEWYLERTHPLVQNPTRRSTYINTTIRDVGATDPWEMLRLVSSLVGSTAQRWRSGDRSISYEELGALIDRVDSVVRVVDEAGPSTAQARPSCMAVSRCKRLSTDEGGPSRMSVSRSRRQSTDEAVSSRPSVSRSSRQH